MIAIATRTARVIQSLAWLKWNCCGISISSLFQDIAGWCFNLGIEYRALLL